MVHIEPSVWDLDYFNGMMWDMFKDQNFIISYFMAYFIGIILDLIFFFPRLLFYPFTGLDLWMLTDKYGDIQVINIFCVIFDFISDIFKILPWLAFRYQWGK